MLRRATARTYCQVSLKNNLASNVKSSESQKEAIDNKKSDEEDLTGEVAGEKVGANENRETEAPDTEVDDRYQEDEG